MVLNPSLHSALGFIALLALAWAIGDRRRPVAWRIVLPAAALTLGLALLLLKAPPVQQAFLLLNGLLQTLQQATQAGTSLVFGYLGGAPLPFEEKPGTSSFVLALHALPLVLVVSALSALLFYWRILPWLVRGLSLLLEKTLGIGGAVGLSTAANVFLGMVEAPLVVRPYLARLSRGELFMVMTCGMAGVAGTVMALYAGVIGSVVPDAMGHILAASIISAPAAIAVSVLMRPPEGVPTPGRLDLPSEARSAMDAVTRGTVDGLQLLLQIAALLVVLVALVTLVNLGLAALPPVAGAALSLERLLGALMSPLVWLTGIPWAEAGSAGALMGVKTVLNEFVAYLQLAQLPAETLSPRSHVIITYALCGFANFGSLGIMLGGLTAMLPQRRDDIVALGLPSLVAGTLSTLVTAAAVGVFL
jgi:CNT family concentrative nucleoside transporter